MIKKASLTTKEAQKWTLTSNISKNHQSMTEHHSWEIILDQLKKRREFSNQRKNGPGFKDILIGLLLMHIIYTFMVQIWCIGELMLLLIRPQSLLKEIQVESGTHLPTFGSS